MYKRFREFRTPFSLRNIRKNPHSMYARVPQAMAQFVLKMARAYGLRPRLWLLKKVNKISLVAMLTV